MHAFRRQYYFHSLAVIIDSIYLPHPTQPPHLISDPISERPLPQSLSSSGSRSVQETRPTNQEGGGPSSLKRRVAGTEGAETADFDSVRARRTPLGDHSISFRRLPRWVGREGGRGRSRGVLCWSVACFSFTARISLGKVASRPAMRAGHPTFMSSK